jgi:hypothetical protein
MQRKEAKKKENRKKQIEFNFYLQQSKDLGRIYWIGCVKAAIHYHLSK